MDCRGCVAFVPDILTPAMSARAGTNNVTQDDDLYVLPYTGSTKDLTTFTAIAYSSYIARAMNIFAKYLLTIFSLLLIDLGKLGWYIFNVARASYPCT